MRSRRERPAAGAIGLQVVLLAAVAGIVVLVVTAAAGSVLVAAGRAQDAADAAAVAAAGAGLEAGTARGAASAAASAHGAALVACACRGSHVRVTVTVPVAAPAARALGITERRASAEATLVEVGVRHSGRALRPRGQAGPALRTAVAAGRAGGATLPPRALPRQRAARRSRAGGVLPPWGR